MLACLLFSCYRMAGFLNSEGNQANLRLVWGLFTMITIVSIAGYLLHLPDFAVTDVWGHIRTSGLYARASKLAQIASINIILVYYFSKSKSFKIAMIAVSVLCLILTGSRTYLVPMVLLAFFFFYSKVALPSVFKIAVFSLIGVVVLSFGLFFLDRGSLTEKSYVRAHSLGTLSGRTGMWAKSLPYVLQKPMGSGYGLGGVALFERAGETNAPKRLLSRSVLDEFDMFRHGGIKSSLHNGYLQAMADVGFVGFLLYIVIFARGAYFAVKTTRNTAIVGVSKCIFVLTAVSNMGENALIGPTESGAALFWMAWFVLANDRSLSVDVGTAAADAPRSGASADAAKPLRV
jgi:O-antigen ligase